MNTKQNAKDIVTFIENEDTRLSAAALSRALKEFDHYESHWFFRYDLRKKELLYFFPLFYLDTFGNEKSKFIEVVKKHWRNAGFEICEQIEMPPSEYFQIGIYTLLFCLKKKA